MEGHERDGSEPEASVGTEAPEDGADPGTRAGAAVGCWLVFLRIAPWGLPETGSD